MYSFETGERRFILKRTEKDKVKTKDSKYDDLGNWRKDIEKLLLTDHQIFSSASNAEHKQENRVLISQENGQRHRKELYKLYLEFL